LSAFFPLVYSGKGFCCCGEGVTGQAIISPTTAAFLGHAALFAIAVGGGVGIGESETAPGYHSSSSSYNNHHHHHHHHNINNNSNNNNKTTTTTTTTTTTVLLLSLSRT